MVVIEWMQETMREAPGVGLAAPQIGLPIQLAVIEDRAEYLEGIAPEILEARERQPHRNTNRKDTNEHEVLEIIVSGTREAALSADAARARAPVAAT